MTDDSDIIIAVACNTTAVIERKCREYYLRGRGDGTMIGLAVGFVLAIATAIFTMWVMF